MLCKYCLSLSIWTLITINLLCFFCGVLKEEPGGSKSSTSDNNPVTEIGVSQLGGCRWKNIKLGISKEITTRAFTCIHLQTSHCSSRNTLRPALPFSLCFTQSRCVDEQHPLQHVLLLHCNPIYAGYLLHMWMSINGK